VKLGMEIMDLKNEISNALDNLRKTEERKFDQTVDLIINLQKFDPKKNQISIFVNMPFRIKEKKICAFFETKHGSVETITLNEFKNYSDKKALKKLVKKFDFFIAQASIMPKVASIFGKVLGPAGKMPSPQLGILMDVNEKNIEEIKKKISNSTKIRIKEASIKLAVGKQSMKNEEITENVLAVYNVVMKELPKGKENIKNIELKFTMTKPEKIKIK
jgi:large subunit ribosomal protein L1